MTKEALEAMEACEPQANLYMAAEEYAEEQAYDFKGFSDVEDYKELAELMKQAVVYGAHRKEQQMMKDAFVFESKHNTACWLASECLRNHGWFGRERDFNDLWQFICGVKELFSGEFKTGDKVKLIIIKED